MMTASAGPGKSGSPMATTAPTHLPTRVRPGAPAPLFGIFLLLWALFVAALIFNQGALDSTWTWFGGLPLVVQVILWVLFLPVMAGLWIWESDWSLWLRLVLIFVVMVGNLAAFSPKSGRQPDGDRTSTAHIE